LHAARPGRPAAYFRNIVLPIRRISPRQREPRQNKSTKAVLSGFSEKNVEELAAFSIPPTPDEVLGKFANHRDVRIRVNIAEIRSVAALQAMLVAGKESGENRVEDE
jgi:hypothetical protein